MTNESPVWVYYEDIATQATLMSPTRLDGGVGEPYSVTIPEITNYTYVDASGDLNSIFGNLPQSLHLYFRPSNWRDAHRITMYIAVQADMLAYEAPDDQAAVSANIPVGSFWATPLRVITANGQFWYQIGDHAWLRYEAHLMVLSDTAPNAENIHYIQAHTVANDQPNAIVNFLPNQATEVFAEPYGLPIGSVADGDFVAIINEQHHDNGIIWYELAHHGWINSLYINKL